MNKTEMTIYQEEWIIKFAKKTEDHEQWLTFIRYGLSTLIKNQPLFIEKFMSFAESDKPHVVDSYEGNFETWGEALENLEAEHA